MEIEICEEFFYRIENKEFDILKKFNTSKENVLRNNEKIKQYSGEWVKIKLNDFSIHYVKPMETLKSIVEIYGIGEEELINENNLTTNKLFIGQRLKIPKTKNKKAHI